MKVPTQTLNNGLKIPTVGLGLWQVKDQETFVDAFDAAYKAGYRLFDSAQFYRNEQYIKVSIQKLKLKREDLFITSKIAVNNFGYNKTKKSFDQTLDNIGSSYIDLMLLHFPVSILRKKSWMALEEYYESKKARSIGVSNYTIRHLEELKKYSKITPVINQVELHVFLQQPDLIKYCEDHNIKIEAYSPLAHGLPFDNQDIIKIAKKYNKSYAQIMLKFLLQLGLIIIPKSVTESRIIENINIFDFEIDAKDMNQLKKLNKDLRTCWNPTMVP